MQPILLNTDWYGISLLLDTPVKDAPKGYQWRVYENGTNVWKMRRIMYSERGDKVFTLLSEPKSSLIDPRAALLEVENEWLYHGIGVRGIERLLMRCCLFNRRGLSRLDLAMDFNPTPAQMDIIYQLADGRAYVQGKRNGSGFWSIASDTWMPPQYIGKRIPHCISWGHKTTDVKWKLYYKTKELKEAAGGKAWDKPYIVDCWREAKLNEADVWRLEVSLHNCNGILWNGEPITRDVWGNNTTQLAKDLYASRFQIRAAEGHKDKSNDRHIYFLPIEGMKVVKCKTTDGLSGHNGRIALLRRLVQSLDDEQVLLDRVSREDVLTHIGSIIKRDNLQRYFQAMTGFCYDDFCANARTYAGEEWSTSGRYDILRINEYNRDIKPNTKFE